MATKRIKDLSTSISAFRSGDVIPVDGPSGTAKMSKDDLLRVTAENGRNPVSMGFVSTQEKAVEVFGETRDVKNAALNTLWNVDARNDICVGLPGNSYGMLQTICGNRSSISAIQIYTTYDGLVFVRTRWGSSVVDYSEWQELDKNSPDLVASMGIIQTEDSAIQILGSARDVGNAPVNKMYNLASSVVVGLPSITDSTGGTLMTFRGNTSGRSRVQIYFSDNGKFYFRIRWGNSSSSYTEWKDVIFNPTSGDLLYAYGFVNSEASAIAEFTADKDVKHARMNSIYSVNSSVCNGLPGNYGFLVTITGRPSGASAMQLYQDVSLNATYIRTRWGSSVVNYSDWIRLDKGDPDILSAMGFVNNAENAVEAFGTGADVSGAKPNTMWNINVSVCNGLPNGNSGTLVTLRGNTSGTSRIQIYVDTENNWFVRFRWGSSGAAYTAWKTLSAIEDNASHIIPQFLQIGACGGSLATGASFYKDSNGEHHGIDNADYSWIQIWGRKHGVDAFNFSQGGMSTKTWLTSPVGLTKAQLPANKCKVYFLLFGGNDIRDYDGLTNLGTISDVHVGNEDQNPATYYGNYSRVLAHLKNIGGQRTKIFAFTYALNFNANTLMPTYNNATKNVCALYDDVFCIDIEHDPIINGEQITAEKYWGHFSAHGYKLIADRLEHLVDKFVEENPVEFHDIQWIGTNYDIAEWY